MSDDFSWIGYPSIVPSWNEVKNHFVIDGSLRDVYVHGTKVEDWNLFLSFVNRSHFRSIFKIDGVPGEQPGTIQEIVTLLDEHSLSLAVYLDEKIQMNCHFFVTMTETSPIELDIDPKEIQDSEAFELFWKFVSNIGNLLNKTIDLTYENSEGEIIASFKP